MSDKIQIKGRVIGEGKPLICVPVVEEQKEQIIDNIKLLAQKKCDMIEWRMDCFLQVQNSEEVDEILTAVKPYLDQTILLLTFRSKRQGGAMQLESKEIMEIYLSALKHGVADLVDVEYFEYVRPTKALAMLKENGVLTVCSHHDFDHTPDDEVMSMILEKMYAGGADIVKLAVMPNDREDVLRLLNITQSFKKDYPNIPAITMSMGKEGVISRISGEVFGSCVTFGAYEKTSAPGQLPMEDLNIILEKIHNSIEE